MNASTGTQSQPERRTNSHLREIYEDAVQRLQHFFHGEHDWAGTSHDFLALRAMHEAYPDLTPAEVRNLVSTIGRRTQDPDVDHTLTA